MPETIVYPTGKTGIVANVWNIFKTILTGVLLGMGLLFLRDVLFEAIMPDGGVLEQLVLMVEENEGGVTQAIAAFCRDTVFHETT